ncbi:DUF948 domain-containing protein [Convivina praedatoris]|uniref:DUF948 domain-containing protein n=1 Tax=Convivina praedatoris TaxID=2880963 RepID=A0ABM9D2C8_9LACO|nr:DUF948 domain-containing protein [Convivina sp. LMG 32447]CAH1852702.1 hypothetical protein LMG032447_00641 [Convivina sp. LMG 32447]CAH1852740.1 hypothetical protein R078138_00651 [Convivina sp. LMG 32447]CAH1854829.1 hypothetical protein R077815_01090 [Convivina sp. LMG 32447]
MTIGQLSILIFALAFLLLVVFIGIFLMRLTRSVAVITMDVDTIARSSNEILGNANELLDDINDKMKTLDVTVDTVAELSETVSDLNSSIHHATNRFSSFGNLAKAGTAFATSQAWERFSRKTNKKKEQK